MWKLVEVRKLKNDDKKYVAVFKNTDTDKTKKTKFGASG